MRSKSGTIEHIRSTMHLLFDEAWRLEIIADNPVLKVKVPPIAYVEKPRVILTDDEVIVFWSCEDAELEIRMLGLVARCEGGMRTRDCTAWDWTMIDRERFASCIVPRTKTGKPQRLDIPDVLQAPLRAWWATQERPMSGPVFPVTRGPRKGTSGARFRRGSQRRASTRSRRWSWQATRTRELTRCESWRPRSWRASPRRL